MRIITGERRGKKLLAPEGWDTRPTSDRVKEAIFNIIQFSVEGKHALDMFAGSGQMGIEAVSRGAYSCVFCEKDKKACDIVSKNLAACGFSERAEVLCGDACTLVKRMKKGRFGLIFLDPPYQSDLLEKALSEICTLDLLNNDGIIVCEIPKGMEIAGLKEPYRIEKEYNYGKTSVVTIVKSEENV